MSFSCVMSKSTCKLPNISPSLRAPCSEEVSPIWLYLRLTLLLVPFNSYSEGNWKRRSTSSDRVELPLMEPVRFGAFKLFTRILLPPK